MRPVEANHHSWAFKTIFIVQLVIVALWTAWVWQAQMTDAAPHVQELRIPKS